MRTKALLNDPTLEFEFVLAEKLGMTVARLRAEMPQAEFVTWGVYLGRKAQREELARLTSQGGGKR